MKQATLIVVLFVALITMIGCGTPQTTFNNGSGDQPLKPITHQLLHRSLVSNYYAGALDVMDATQNRLTNYSFGVGVEPTYLQPSPDGTLTFVNNTGSNSISSFNNNLEAVKPPIELGGWTESFVTSVSNKVGFAAVPNYSNGLPPNIPGAINRFNPTDGSLNTAIPFPYVHYLAMDPAEKHLLAFTHGDTTHGDDNVYWVDLGNNDPVSGFPALSVIALPIGTLSRPVAAFFSADGSAAYILSCGAECGGSGSASVTEIDTITYSTSTPASNYGNYETPIYQGTANVVQQWAVNGARIGMIDLTANKLYVAGSTGTLVDAGGNTVQNGYFTIIDLANPAATPTSIPIGNGVKRWIRNINGTFWVASLNCGAQSCVSMVNPTTGTATELATANGDATGISVAAIQGNIHDDVYTIEGGHLYIYDQQGNPVTSEYTTDVKGQASDVIYVN